MWTPLLDVLEYLEEDDIIKRIPAEAALLCGAIGYVSLHDLMIANTYS